MLFLAECLLEKDRGPCDDAKNIRFFFNKKTNKCKKFKYGGCEGNKNNFPSKTACKNYCKVGVAKKRSEYMFKLMMATSS